MKLNQWTLGLAAAGVVSLTSAVRAEEEAQKVKKKPEIKPEDLKEPEYKAESVSGENV